MAKQKMKPVEVETGKRYRGSAVMNEYGEFNFTPYGHRDEGEEANAMRVITQTKEYTLYRSEKTIKVAVSVPKGNPREVHDKLATAFSHALVKLDDYEL